MNNHSKFDSFEKERAKSYDQNNSHLRLIFENLHYLIKIILSENSPSSKILCVGVGTGNEIIELAEAFPNFTFVAVDPSLPMLEVCQDKLEKMNLLDRCKLIHGYVEDIPETIDFDAALCLLVLHHTPPDSRIKIIKEVFKRLKSAGHFICAEISFTFSAIMSGDIIEKWKSLIRLSGASEEKAQSLPKMMEKHLFIQTPSEVERIMMDCGFSACTQFFQALLIRAWYARK